MSRLIGMQVNFVSCETFCKLCPQKYFHLNPASSKVCGCYVLPFSCSTHLDLHNKTRVAVAKLQWNIYKNRTSCDLGYWKCMFVDFVGSPNCVHYRV